MPPSVAGHAKTPKIVSSPVAAAKSRTAQNLLRLRNEAAVQGAAGECIVSDDDTVTKSVTTGRRKGIKKKKLTLPTNTVLASVIRAIYDESFTDTTLASESIPRLSLEVLSPKNKTKDIHSKKFPFPFKLYDLVNNAVNFGYDDIVSWTNAGRSFIVHDHNRFSHEILPVYYGHSTLRSFIRQLSYWGFQRQCSADIHHTSLGGLAWSHRHFAVGARKHDLQRIERQRTKNMVAKSNGINIKPKTVVHMEIVDTVDKMPDVAIPTQASKTRATSKSKRSKAKGYSKVSVTDKGHYGCSLTMIDENVPSIDFFITELDVKERSSTNLFGQPALADCCGGYCVDYSSELPQSDGLNSCEDMFGSELNMKMDNTDSNTVPGDPCDRGSIIIDRVQYDGDRVCDACGSPQNYYLHFMEEISCPEMSLRMDGANRITIPAAADDCDSIVIEHVQRRELLNRTATDHDFEFVAVDGSFEDSLITRRMVTPCAESRYKAGTLGKDDDCPMNQLRPGAKYLGRVCDFEYEKVNPSDLPMLPLLDDGHSVQKVEENKYKSIEGADERLWPNANETDSVTFMSLPPPPSPEIFCLEQPLTDNEDHFIFESHSNPDGDKRFGSGSEELQHPPPGVVDTFHGKEFFLVETGFIGIKHEDKLLPFRTICDFTLTESNGIHSYQENTGISSSIGDDSQTMTKDPITFDAYNCLDALPEDKHSVDSDDLLLVPNELQADEIVVQSTDGYVTMDMSVVGKIGRMTLFPRKRANQSNGQGDLDLTSIAL